MCNAVMNMHKALTYFNTLQKPVNIKASALLIIHIWSKDEVRNLVYFSVVISIPYTVLS